MLPSLPCDDASPAAIPSASFTIVTAVSMSLFRSCTASRSCSRAPFNCGRFGASSTTPFFTSPGTASPTAAMSLAPFAASTTCSQIACTRASMCNSTRASMSSSLSGKRRRAPSSLWFTTSPAEMPSVKMTPIVFAMSYSASPGTRVFLLELADAIQPVESRNFITFRERWVVEDCIHEIIQLSAQRHHRLTDVQQLARALADDVHAKDRMRHPVEDQLQPSRGIPADLSARNLAIVRHADLVGNVLLGQLLLRLPDKADLRNRIDPIRIQPRIRQHVVIPKRPRRSHPALLHRHRSQRREPDHIAHRKDRRNLRPQVLIHRHAPARVP